MYAEGGRWCFSPKMQLDGFICLGGSMWWPSFSLVVSCRMRWLVDANQPRLNQGRNGAGLGVCGGHGEEEQQPDSEALQGDLYSFRHSSQIVTWIDRVLSKILAPAFTPQTCRVILTLLICQIYDPFFSPSLVNKILSYLNSCTKGKMSPLTSFL